MVDSDLKKVSYYRCHAKDYLKTNDFKNARYCIKKALSILPHHFESIFVNGLIEKKAKNYEAAIKSFEYLATTVTFRAKATYELGKIYFDLKKYYKALDYFEDYYSEAIYTENPLISYQNQIKGLTQMVYIYKIVHDYDNEIKIYNKLLALEKTSKYSNPQNIFSIYHQIASAYSSNHDLANALKYYEMLTTNDNKYQSDAFAKIARFYFNNHDFDLAEENLNLSLNKNNQNFEAKFILAKIKAIKKDYATSLNILKSLLETKVKKEAEKQIICILFKMEKYNEIKVFKNIDLNDINSYKTQIYFIAKSKMGENTDFSSDIFNVYQNYSYENVLNNLKNKISGNIEHLLEIIKNTKLVSKYYYGSDIFDNYIIPIANIGYVDNEKTDFLYVKTLINTHDIIDVYPCLNLNNAHKISELKLLKLN